MANEKDTNKYQFNTNDINESRYIIEMIYRHVLDIRKPRDRVYEMNNDELSEKINSLSLDKVDPGKIRMYSEKYREEMKTFRKRNLSWIEDDFYSALYLWFFLFVYRPSRRSVFDRNDISSRAKKATPEIINNIIIDILEYSSSEFSQLERIEKKINRAHEKYQDLTGVKRLSWLKNDDEQITWAYQYLKEKDRDFSRNYAIDHVHSLVCIKVYYDLHINDKAVRYIFIEMSNAWNQKRYREKRKSDNKKALSGYISSEAKNRLRDIAEKENISESEMIEFLIMTADF